VQRYVTWKTKGRLRCGLSEAKREIGLMEDFFFYAQRRGGRKPAEELRTRRDGNRRNQLASTIKERNSCNYVD
jgi:hypothetical protein